MNDSRYHPAFRILSISAAIMLLACFIGGAIACQNAQGTYRDAVLIIFWFLGGTVTIAGWVIAFIVFRAMRKPQSAGFDVLPAHTPPAQAQPPAPTDWQ